PDEFLTEKIRATNDFKEYEMVYVGLDVTMNQLQLVFSTQGTHRLEPESYKEYPKIINNDDEEIEKEKKDEEIKKEKKQDDEKIDEVVMEKDDDDDVEKVDEVVK
nr:hypothetical protein [Tanacetum cinerariifolium]